ncbi:Aerotolerance protein BatB / Aerotolerance protein BatC [hydrothermal vent metagenome]|uniref:Aerotolerance protein BatB / Aerotolerance protein BatC n=1 Tax=hydrothermal vent metagenome TaxID=652676 RepID=A0A3B0XSQ6_9ZZZZ
MDNLQWLLQLHLIRPYWLLALIPLALIIWIYSRVQSRSRSWASVIDPKLLPHLLQHNVAAQKKIPVILLSVLASLLVFALAGPAFEKRSQPVFKTRSALVILLDLSLSMDATDVKPSRLSRAHFKIEDILKQRREGQTALIAYAANAYTVSPLTDDAGTISAQIQALQTDIMPGQGSRLDLALKKARELFTNAGHSKGDIFIISDGINKKALNIIKQLKSEGYTSSVLAIGTANGAPIALPGGGFVKDRNGDIVIPKLDLDIMRQAARAGGGKFSLLSAGDRDIDHLMSNIDIDKNTDGNPQTDQQKHPFKTDVWHEEGPWLLLLVIPFAAYAFRKGLIFLLLVFILPLPQPAQASVWTDLWKNSDQQGEAALQQGEAEKAAELFKNPQWKAAAHYKAGQYEQASEILSSIDTAEANYNRGNALAKAGQIDRAIEAYDRALELQADHEDAKYNKQLLEKAKQENKDDKKDDRKDKDDQNKDSEQSDDKKSDPNKSDPEKSDQEKSDQGKSDKEKSDNSSDSDKSQPDKSNAENKSDQSEQKNEPDEQQQNNKDAAAEEKEADNKEADEQSAAEREAEKQQQEKEAEERKQQAQQLADETPDLSKQQTQQWLKKIPDDPGGLLRRKFKYQYSRQQTQEENQPW